MRKRQEEQYEPQILYLIYALVDPHTEEVRYIGITNDMTNRFMNHLRAAGSRTLKGAWLEDLQNEGLQPLVKTLEEVKVLKTQRNLAEERERYWIHKFEQSGASLTNIKDTKSDPRKSSRIHSNDTNKQALKVTQEKRNRSKAIYTLDELRIRAGLRINELAKLANISSVTLSNMMHGQATNRAFIFRVVSILSKRLGQEITPDMIKGLRVL